ncbi:MAG: alpha-xylosidase [Bifidobacteriaceae bacterium]|nr:alpha-xylosidase [Bifidobacteriaceae bacterium]
MKFKSGKWLLHESVRAAYATQAVDVRCTEDQISLAALTQPLRHRGSVLNTPTITVDLSSPAPEVVRVRATHHSGVLDPGPHFEVHQAPGEARVTQSANAVALATGQLTARISLQDRFELSWTAEGRELTHLGPEDLGYMEVGDDGPFMMARLALGVGASVYGLGERFTALVKNGQVVDSWNEDGGVGSEQSYKAVPFYWSTDGYGVFVNTPALVSFEVASEVTNAVQFAVRGQTLEFMVIYGPTPAQIIERYTQLTGRPALPPAWSFGLWLSTSFTTGYTAATVRDFVETMAHHDIPLSVLHFDSYWMKALCWCDFEWDQQAFPDPAGLLGWLRERGIHPSVWINPYIGQRSPLFAQAAAAGYLARRPDGSVWQWDLWVAGMGLVDFTNPGARAWFADKIKALVATGIDAVKTDFGERIPLDVAWFDGSDPERMHNYYSFLYNQSVFEALRSVRGEGEAVVFARSGTAGSQQFPVHWGGDCDASYVSMAESLRAGLSLGLSGFAFWSHDIGGFEGTPSPELFQRWAAFGLLSSHSRLHGSTSYRVPWEFGPDSVRVVRFFARLKNRLMPYMWRVGVEAHQRGLPVLRATVLEFPDDPTARHLESQYLLGPDLLVAPIFRPNGAGEAYLPAGLWTEFFTGERLAGPAWWRGQCRPDRIPLFVREGASIVQGSREDRPDYDYAEGFTVEVFALPDGADASAQIWGTDGTLALTVHLHRTGRRVSARLDGRIPHQWSLRWVAGPLGPARGPVVTAASDSCSALFLDIPDGE